MTADFISRYVAEHPHQAAKAVRVARRYGNTERAEEILAELAEQGRCRICGALLLDPESIEAGIGPVCRDRQRHQGQEAS